MRTRLCLGAWAMAFSVVRCKREAEFYQQQCCIGPLETRKSCEFREYGVTLRAVSGTIGHCPGDAPKRARGEVGHGPVRVEPERPEERAAVFVLLGLSADNPRSRRSAPQVSARSIRHPGGGR